MQIDLDSQLRHPDAPAGPSRPASPTLVKPRDQHNEGPLNPMRTIVFLVSAQADSVTL